MQESSVQQSHVHAPPTSFIRKYVFSLDHKMIGKQYYGLALIAVFTGMFLSWLMRIHMVWPDAKLPLVEWLSKNGAPGGIITPEYYLSLLTMHGTLMVFFVLTNAPFAALGNYFLPIQIGAEDMAFPRFNMMSFWITFVAWVVLMLAFFIPDGPPIAGWTSYAPLSAVGKDAGPGMEYGMSLWGLSIAIFCVASLLGALNFIATTLDLRAKGMTLMRMPICTWAWFITSCIALLAFAVLLPACVLLILDRHFGTSFYIPGGLVVSDRLQPHSGGSPLLWQHLFWFFGHPEVYIAILPGMGIVSLVISKFSGKPVFGYRMMVGASIAIAFLGLLLWGHHMFVSGLNPWSAVAFSFLTMAIGAPSAVKTFNWIATAWGGSLRLTTPMLFALGFVSIFVTGGLSGLFLGQPEIDAYFHDTYFVVAHFHLIMGLAALFGIFAATFYWFPTMFGRMMDERLGKVHFYLTFIGAYATFLPMHFAGFAGNPRRYADFTTFDFLAPVMPLQRWITYSAFFLASVQVIFLWNLFQSIWRGPGAPDSPWDPNAPRR